jgi:hypothetical protein
MEKPSHDPSGLSAMIRQSPPIDLSIPYDASWVKDKTILVTGGASGSVLYVYERQGIM